MKQTVVKNSVIKVILVLIFASSTIHHLQGISPKELERATKKAKQEEKTARKHHSELAELEEKLEKAIAIVEERRKNLDIVTAAQPRVEANIRRADGSLRKATNKVIKLTEKVEECRAKVQEANKDAEQAQNMTDKLATQREYELAKKEFERATGTLEFYQNKIDELETEERELRAVAIAKKKVAARKGGQINTWKTDVEEKLTETRADFKVEQLRKYREKVTEAEKEVKAATERLREKENKLEQYAGE